MASVTVSQICITYPTQPQTLKLSPQPVQVTPPTERQKHLDAVCDIIRSFVNKTGCHDFSNPSLITLENAISQELKTLGMDVSLFRRWITWTCQLIECFYPTHPLEIKVLLSLCTLVVFYVDDVLSEDVTTLLSVQPNLLAGRDQTDPVLQCLVKTILPRMWDHFEPLAATSVSIGMYDYINGTAMEHLGKNMTRVPSAPDFPEFLRLKAGVPGPFAFWIFYTPSRTGILSYIQTMPDLCAVIDRVNDILSFYKEELDGEEDNYVHGRAKSAGISTLVALQNICGETLQLCHRVSDTLISGGNSNFLELFRIFITGYVRFHIVASRYKFKEILAFKAAA